MIESQTKLPAREKRAVTVWSRGREVFSSLASQIKRQVRALPGSPIAKRVRAVGLFAQDVAGRTPWRSYAARLFQWVRAGVGDGPLLSRFALHLVVVFLAIGIVAVGQFSLPEVDFSLPTPTPAPELGEHTVTTPLTNRGANRFVDNNIALFQAPVPHTVLAERETTSVITYTVQPNDNIWAIAQGFGLNAETVLWANPKVESSPDLLSVGQVLVIPPVDGIYYTVQAGDTVEKLAKTYQTSVDKIVNCEMNGLTEPYTLTPGQQIMLPDGRKKPPAFENIYPMTYVGSAPKGAPKGSGRFAWPTRGVLTQKFWSGHPGIDIANRTGTPIYAADDGYVVLAGRDTWGYGNQVVIDHGNGYKTRYAHLSRIDVKAGQTVKKNQQIGLMGSTGRSTGPHLHFEVIYNGAVRNPLGFLP
jgi:murein DD-endopeptidase MepM/ murein hydrolase activator NlpD